MALAKINQVSGTAVYVPGSDIDTDRIIPKNANDLVASASAQLVEICERIAALPGMSVGLAEELVKLDAVAQSLKSGR